MDKRFLEDCLAKGMSLEKIGDLVGKHPSTVAYWLRKHGLRAVGSARHTPKGSVDKHELRNLVEAGASMREIAAQLNLGLTTIRYWINRLGLETERMQWRRQNENARRQGLKRIYRRCAYHGHTGFYLRPDGGWRCMRCNQERVVEWRRNVKRRLIQEAGGACAVCGYDRDPRALHFHHLDPEQKVFTLSRFGATRSFAEAQVEAAKCVLLCANCHAEVESGITEISVPPVKVEAA